MRALRIANGCETRKGLEYFYTLVGTALKAA